MRHVYLDEKILYLIAGAFISFIPSMIIEIIRYLIEISKEKRKHTYDLESRIYDTRLNAYKEMYTCLNVIKDIFTNNLIDDKTVSLLTEKYVDLRMLFNKNGIYYSKRSKDAFEQTADSISQRLDYLQKLQDKNKPMKKDQNLPDETTYLINNYLEIIRKDSGIGHLDKIY